MTVRPPLFALVSTWISVVAALAQPAPGPLQPSGIAQPPAASPGLVNDWLRGQSPAFSKWDLGGQFRARFEHREDLAIPGWSPAAVDFRNEGGADNSYLLLRAKLHLGYRPTDWLGAFVEGRDSSSHWDRRTPHPETDRWDLHQGFVTLGDPQAFPLTAKIGRQELSYGDERLVGAFDWNNIGRVFDAAKARFEHTGFWADAFVGRVIIPRNRHFNVPNDYDVFSGLYTSTRTLIPRQETQLYFLARNVGSDSPEALGRNLPAFLTGASPRDVYTLGARVKSLPGQFAGWDYAAEIAGQLGNFKFTPEAERLDHRAFAAHAAGGYTWSQAWATPRLGLEYNYATGDDDPSDGAHGTFDNLFPTNHRFYGFMDLFAWQNIHNARLAASLKPLRKLTLTADYHAFWLADTRDFFYQASGAPRRTGGYGIQPHAGNFVGTELDVIATYHLTQYAALQAGYGHFFVGDYAKDSLAPVGGTTDADWVYVQVAFNF